jgi:hypothetical protein
VISNELNFDLPVVPAKAEEPEVKSSKEPVFEPVTPPTPPTIIIPVKGEDKAPKPPIVLIPDTPAPSADQSKPPTIVIPDLTPAPNADKSKSPPPLVDLDTPPAPTKPSSPAPPAKPETIPPPAIDLDPTPVAPQAKPTPPATPKPELSQPVPPVSGAGQEIVLPPIAESPKVPMKTEPVSPVAPPTAPTAPGTKNVDPPVNNELPKSPMPLIREPVPSTPKVADGAKLKLLLRVGDGQPRFEIRNTASSDLLLKVYGEKVEMQSPNDGRSSLAGVTAIGRVRFTAPGIEGTCDHLTILSATGEVLMKGNIRMKTKHGRSWSEMTAEKMVYQIGTNGLASSESRPAVRPASYIPD